MALSEAQAEARLAELRRQRDAIEREMADLVLYLDLGRRLGGAAGAGAASEASRGLMPAPASSPVRETVRAAPPAPAPAPAAPFAAPFAPAPPVGAAAARPVPASPPLSSPEPEEPASGLSETVLARRYGRALVEAALAVLEEAGRPLHASEIWGHLSARGFALPGQDPVAALNTRLWKRSGPGGPLRRLGEAVYAPAEAEEG
ncbi:winged helix-turn-helix domain-containing protein [Methylobacterium sp. Leaf118]|uniref:winged helix-turn-helix domain-containing protein n=1 Tax=Methylobacterium sp. Leaf118 TaxID=2876562 RepID=UPI001E38052C|nr:HTH domain-containing protein [Methylobacterium sp. Leaf118]